jgi:hypothetical protein
MAGPNKISEMLESRERWGRLVVTLLLVGFLGTFGIYFWGLLVPWLLDVVTDTVKLAVLSAAFGAVLWMCFDPKMRTLALYAYRSFTRFLTSQFIDIDPIGILNSYVSRLKERLEEMDKAIGSLQGQRDQLSALIQKNEEERIHSLKRAKHAQELVAKGGEDAAQFRGEIALSGRQAGRLGKSNETLSNLLKRIDALLKALKKMRDTSSVLVQDIEAEVKVRTEEFKAITKGFSAFKRAQKMMAASGPEKELYDETLNKLANDYSDKMGQIEYFMEVSRSIINGVDLDNMEYEESALAQLEKWESGSTGVRVEGGDAPKVRVGEAEQESPDSFGSLFNDDKSGKA